MFPDLNLLGLTWIAAIVDFLWRSMMLAALCLLLDWVLRKRSADFRDQLWRAMLFALWTLPMLSLLLPPLLHPAAVSTITFDRPSLMESTLPMGRPMHVHAEFRMAPDLSPWVTFVVSLYVAVALLLLLRLAYAMNTIRRIVSRSTAPTEAPFRNLIHEVWLQSEAAVCPLVRLSAEVRVPLVVECNADSFILLPAKATKWDKQRLQLVLAHEMGHVRRNDSAITRLSWFTACLLWFHPLAWFLRSRLATTAEECCDELVLLHTHEAHEYAGILLAFASETSASGSRVIQPASAFLHNARLERRIDHIFEVSGQSVARKRFSQAFVLALFLPSLYLAAAGRNADPQLPVPLASPRVVGGVVPTSEEAKQLEEQLAADPDNLDAHGKLLVYYQPHPGSPEFAHQLIWMIQHYPDDGLASLSVQPRAADGQITREYAEVEAAWQMAIAQHSDSAIVLLHAGEFYLLTNSERALELFQKGREVAPPEQTDMMISAMANLYVRAFWNRSRERFSASQQDPSLAERLRQELDNSADAPLVSKVGTELVSIGRSVNDPRLTTKGFELVDKATTLDSTNQSLKDAQESVRHPEAQPAIRIGEKVAEANLESKVEPIYPQLAHGVQGTVVFTITIGTDGRVEKIRLERGHPLLVNAAREAVQQYRYKPTRLAGKPVAVTTQVKVPFVLER